MGRQRQAGRLSHVRLFSFLTVCVFAWHSLLAPIVTGLVGLLQLSDESLAHTHTSDGRTSHCCLARGQESVALCGGQAQLSGKTLYDVKLVW